MYLDKDSWLNNIKTVAKKFVENNYLEELPLFDTFWQVFSAKINEAIKSDSAGCLTFEPTNQIITEVSFIKGYSHDFVSPVVALTVAEVLHEMNTKKYSSNKLEDIIHSAATRHGAKPSLTACLIRGLSVLCNEIQACKDNNSNEAIISESPRPSEYRIWTEGKKITLGNIGKYEKNKDKYLLWLDLDAPAQGLTPKSISLLKHLVENIGTPMSIAYVLRDVFDDKASDDDKEGDINKINQQLVKLETFCKKRFRQYIMEGWPKESLGLNNDFRDKYFLFKRVAPDRAAAD